MIIFDLHNDFATVLPYGEYKRYYRDKHDYAIVAAIWTTEMQGDVATRVADIRNNLIKARGGMLTRVAIEDIGFTAERDAYKKFDFGRFSYCSLTWNYNNAFAGGALDDGGLTEKGESVIRYMQDAGCLIDLAHLNKKSFFDVIDRVECGILCSHTGFTNHPRCLSDDMIREIIARNGVIGLSLVKAFNGAENSEQFANVVDRYVQKYGIASLAIGTDYYGSTDLTDGMSVYSSIDSILYYLTLRGYTKDDVERILFHNAQKLLR